MRGPCGNPVLRIGQEVAMAFLITLKHPTVVLVSLESPDISWKHTILFLPSPLAHSSPPPAFHVCLLKPYFSFKVLNKLSHTLPWLVLARNYPSSSISNRQLNSPFLSSFPKVFFFQKAVQCCGQKQRLWNLQSAISATLAPYPNSQCLSVLTVKWGEVYTVVTRINQWTDLKHLKGCVT